MPLEVMKAFEEKLKRHGLKAASAPAPRPGLWFQEPTEPSEDDPALPAQLRTVLNGESMSPDAPDPEYQGVATGRPSWRAGACRTSGSPRCRR